MGKYLPLGGEHESPVQLRVDVVHQLLNRYPAFSQSSYDLLLALQAMLNQFLDLPPWLSDRWTVTGADHGDVVVEEPPQGVDVHCHVAFGGPHRGSPLADDLVSREEYLVRLEVEADVPRAVPRCMHHFEPQRVEFQYVAVLQRPVDVHRGALDLGGV